FGGGGPYSQRAWGAQNISAIHVVFDVGGFKNETVAGFDVNYQENHKAFYAYTLPPLSSGIYLPSTPRPARNAIAINLLTGAGAPRADYLPFRPAPSASVPTTGIPLTSITNNTYITDSAGTAADYAGFITHRFFFTPAASVSAGVRYDDYEAKYGNLLISNTRQSFESISHLTSPHVSLVYEPSAEQTYYVSWARSATPVGSGIVGTATPIAGATQAFEPDE